MPEIENNNLNNAKNVEKLLKGYGESRRALIGDDIELSPSRRNALLSEALKTYSKQDVLGNLLSLLALRWVRIGALAVLVLITGILVFKSNTHQKELTLAKKEIESEQTDSQKVSPGKDVERKLVPAIAEKESLPADKLEQPVLKMAAEVQKVEEKKLEQIAQPETVRREVEEVRPTSKSALVESPKAIIAKADGVAVVDRTMISRDAGAMQNINNLDKALENFRVEIRGSNIVLVEADGSKYEGIVVNKPEAITNAIQSEFHYSNFVANFKPDSFSIARKQVQTENNQTTQKELYFNVRGTNKGIQNYIEFSGRFIQSITDAASNIQKSPAESAQQDNQLAMKRNIVAGAPSGGVANARMRSAPAVMGAPQPQMRGQTPPPVVQSSQPQTTESQAIIEGILTIGNFTNIPVRAIMNNDGSFIRITNR